jgi:aerobic-type carbon monoxide dehydrogenase small subunit (CoxS/CutS family)
MMKTSTTTGPPTDPVETAFTVNGEEVCLALDPRESLLDVLRERLVLTGTKKGCDQGQCGACTVHIDGRRVVSCLIPAVQVAGQDVMTIEGVAAPDGTLHPLQQAFVDCDALQCGYCTHLALAHRRPNGAHARMPCSEVHNRSHGADRRPGRHHQHRAATTSIGLEGKPQARPRLPAPWADPAAVHRNGVS